MSEGWRLAELVSVSCHYQEEGLPRSYPKWSDLGDLDSAQIFSTLGTLYPRTVCSMVCIDKVANECGVHAALVCPC